MSKKKNMNRLDAFGGDMNDLTQIADEIYGASNGPALDTGRIVAVPTSIHEIVPDPRQPRRVVPHVVRQDMKGGLPPSVFNTWMLMAYCETTGTPLDKDTKRRLIASSEVESLYKQIITGDEVKVPEQPGPIERSMLAVATLAADIYRNGGLTNPITIARNPAQDSARFPVLPWVIETGERRWMAYHLLSYYEFDGFEMIPAQVVEFNVWRQASENSQRSDLNAIGRARQYAILLMDLLTQGGATFEPMEAFDHEQFYYAQVADERIPYGKAEEILNAMNVKARQSLNNYAQILKLPNAYWVRGDDLNWGVADLLKIVSNTDNSDSEIVQSLDNLGDETAQAPSPPAAGQGENIPNAADQPEAKPVNLPWPGVGDEVVVMRGKDPDKHYRGVVMRISRVSGGVYYEVKVRQSIKPYGRDELREPTPADYARWNGEVEVETGLLHPEWPSDDPVVERARGIALWAIGDSHQRLTNRMQNPGSFAGPDDDSYVYFGGGSAWINIQMPNEQEVTFAKDQVLIRLGERGEQRAYRFNAKRLLDWKLSNMPRETNPAPSTERGEAQAEFEIGEAVMVKHTEEIGKLIAVEYAPGQVMSYVWVEINEDRHKYNPFDIMSLGQTYEEYIAEEIANDPGVTFDEPGSEPEVPTGKSERALKRILGTTDDHRWWLLHYWMEIASEYDDEETGNLLNDMHLITVDTVRQMAEAGTLEEMLDGYYAHIEGLLGKWLDEEFAQILAGFEKLAEDEVE